MVSIASVGKEEQGKDALVIKQPPVKKLSIRDDHQPYEVVATNSSF
jgi:hypothetical protein